MKWYRKIILIIIAIAVLSAVAYGFIPKPMRVDAATISRGRLRVTIEEEGRPVVIGQRSAMFVEVVSGLKEGEQVITHPFDSLTDGARVRVRQTEVAGG